MANIGFFAITLLFCTAAQSQRNQHRPDALGWESITRHTRSTELGDEGIRKILRKIASGTSSEEDDARLVNSIKEEIVQTAYRIKMPEGSIEVAAQRAQKLVSELTASYTTAIYKSKSSQDARANFTRFRKTVEEIVDFIKNGKFAV